MDFNINCLIKIKYSNKVFTSLYICTFILIISAYAQPPAYSKETRNLKNKFIESSKYCSDIYNTSVAEMLSMFIQSKETGSQQGMCFLFCMLKRYQLMDKNGMYRNQEIERFLNTIPDSNFKTSLKTNKENCLRESRNAKNSCQKAYQFSKCFYRNGGTKNPAS